MRVKRGNLKAVVNEREMYRVLENKIEVEKSIDT